MTSDQLAKAMQTHPVVIRRILGGLRDAGFDARMAARSPDILEHNHG